MGVDVRRKFVALAVALALPGAFTVIPLAGAASAVTPTIVTCTAFGGTAKAGGSAAGCNQKTITGGSGHLSVTNKTGTKFSILWKSKKTSSGTSSFKVVAKSKCPKAMSEEILSTSKVTGGTAKPLIGGTATNTICVNAKTGTFAILAHTTYKV
jgi:hypothetical protein